MPRQEVLQGWGGVVVPQRVYCPEGSAEPAPFTAGNFGPDAGSRTQALPP